MTPGHNRALCWECLEPIVIAAIEQRDAEHMAGYRELAAREIQLRAENARLREGRWNTLRSNTKTPPRE